MTPRKFASSVFVLTCLAISGIILRRDQAEWIKNLAIGTVLLLGLAAVYSEWNQSRANRRASRQAKFGKMTRHDNAK